MLSATACSTNPAPSINVEQNNYDNNDDKNEFSANNSYNSNSSKNNDNQPTAKEAEKCVEDFLNAVFSNAPAQGLNLTLCGNRFWETHIYNEMLSEFEDALNTIQRKMKENNLSVTFDASDFEVYYEDDSKFDQFVNDKQYYNFYMWDEGITASVDDVSAVALGSCEISTINLTEKYPDKVVLYYMQGTWYLHPASIAVILNDCL